MDDSTTKDGQGQDATVLTPGTMPDTHGSPASEEGNKEDMGQQ